MTNSVVIASFARTPIAKFCGSFQSLTGPKLGSVAIRGALSKLPEHTRVNEVYLGNVLSAGMGQAPARQAALGAEMPTSTICTTVNKVCASGMKSTMLAAQSVQLRGGDVLLSGGFESMSNAPHYLQKSREGFKLGNTNFVDAVIHDGLWDVYNNQHMGMCGEKCARDYDISREQQDAYAMTSYARARDAIELGKFADEIVPVEVPQRKGDPLVVSHDEEPSGVDFVRIPKLKPAFQPDGGTVTAANASSLNDGAAAMVLCSETKAKELGINPLARIRGFGDAAQAPEDFTTSPSLAVPVALKNANMDIADVDFHEINEAFSVVALANILRLDLDPDKVNCFGGAVAIGHPIGMSGARIIGTLYSVLKDKDATIGCASICNGGGGASAIIIERMN